MGRCSPGGSGEKGAGKTGTWGMGVGNSVEEGLTRSSAQVQITCCSGPTTNSHERPPATNTAAVMPNGARKLPVFSTTSPVNAGPITPAQLAKPFCRPVHRPAAWGPASVWRECEDSRPGNSASRTRGHKPAQVGVRSRDSAAGYGEGGNGVSQCHCRFAHERRCSTSPDPEVREPTGYEGRCSVHQVVHAGGPGHRLHGEMPFAHKIEGQPSDHEIQEVVS